MPVIGIESTTFYLESRHAYHYATENVSFLPKETKPYVALANEYSFRCSAK